MAKPPPVRTEQEPSETEADRLRQMFAELRDLIPFERVPPKTEADRLRQQISELRFAIDAEIRHGMAPRPRIVSAHDAGHPDVWTLSHQHRLADLQAELAGKQAELALLLREPPAALARGYVAKDNAIAREVLAEDKGRTASLWALAKQHGHRLEGWGTDETKWTRLRRALRRVTGR
jgi:hypothetical protein